MGLAHEGPTGYLKGLKWRTGPHLSVFRIFLVMTPGMNGDGRLALACRASLDNFTTSATLSLQLDLAFIHLSADHGEYINID